jgi:hypothetical protein
MIDQGFATGGARSIDAFLLLFSVALALACRRRRASFFVSLLGERVVADLRATPVSPPAVARCRLPRPQPQRRTGSA